MKLIFVTLALVAVALAAPPALPQLPQELKIIETLRSEYDQKPEGSYSFSFETENGINRNEAGEVKEVLDEEKKPHVVVIVRGSYSFPKEDGTAEVVNYWADENGYHAEGDSIPKVAGSLVL